MHRDSDHFKKLKALNKDVEMLYDIDSNAHSKAQSDTLCNPGDVLVKHKDGKTVFEVNRDKNTTNYGVSGGYRTDYTYLCYSTRADRPPIEDLSVITKSPNGHLTKEGHGNDGIAVFDDQKGDRDFRYLYGRTVRSCKGINGQYLALHTHKQTDAEGKEQSVNVVQFSPTKNDAAAWIVGPKQQKWNPMIAGMTISSTRRLMARIGISIRI